MAYSSTALQEEKAQKLHDFVVYFKKI